MYAGHQRGQQFADVRNSGAGRNTLGAPPASQNSQNSPKTGSAAANTAQGMEPHKTPPADSIFGPTAGSARAAASGNVTIAGSAEAKAADGAYGSSSDVSWGSCASDRNKKEGKK
jgi:hypothetical protein